MNKIKEMAINWAEGLFTGVVLNEELKESIVSEMENIPSTCSNEFRDEVKSILVEMAVDDKLPLDINDLDINGVFDKAEERLYSNQ